MKKQNIDIFVLIVMSVVLFGCKQEQKTGQQEVAEEEAECEVVNRVGIYALPGDYEVDYPKDLVAYFDSLCREGAYVATHTDEKEDSLAVWDAIIEASATDINPKQIARSVGSCTQGIIPNELGKSKDPFIQSLIDKSYFGRFGSSAGYSIPGRTTLGMWGGGTDKPGTVSTQSDSQ